MSEVIWQMIFQYVVRAVFLMFKIIKFKTETYTDILSFIRILFGRFYNRFFISIKKRVPVLGFGMHYNRYRNHHNAKMSIFLWKGNRIQVRFCWLVPVFQGSLPKLNFSVIKLLVSVIKKIPLIFISLAEDNPNCKHSNSFLSIKYSHLFRNKEF